MLDSPGETIYFGSLEFTTDRFGKLSLSMEGNDSGAKFVRMVHIKLPSLYTTLQESSDNSDIASGRGGSSGFPALEGLMW
jgi:hypothetical protein